MYTPFKMKGKSPLMKKLIGNQHRLPEHLKAKIEAAPESPTKMMKKSPTKMAKKSPTKKNERLDAKGKQINQFSAEYKRMTVSQRKRKYGDDYKSRLKGSGKTGTIKTALEKIDKFVKPGEKKHISVKNIVKGKGKVIKSGPAPSNTTKKKTTKPTKSTNTTGYKSRGGGDPYKYKKNADGSYSYIGPGGKTGTIKKGGGGYDALEKSTLKMKKKSMAKMAKKSPAKKYKSDAQRKAVHASKADGGKGAPTKMMKKSATKMMKKSPTTLKKKVKK